MKLVLIIVLISVVMIIANAISEQYKDKYNFYINLKAFLTQFKLNISFKQEKIIEFLNGMTAKKHFKQFIEVYKMYLSEGKLDLKNLDLLEQEEQNQLEDIIVNLGTHDVKTELSQLDSFIYLIDVKLQIATNNKNKLCPLIIKLSTLFAVGVAILLI